MYGLVCENVAAYIKHKFGRDAWENIRRLANIDTPSFSIHQVMTTLTVLVNVPKMFLQKHFLNILNFKLHKLLHT